MKPRKVEIKLSLKKQTISNLNNQEMDIIKGGTEDSSACISITICNSRPLCWPVSPACPATTN